MDFKFESSDKIMVSKIVQVVKIINIIDFCFIVFTFFKMVLDIERLYPSRIKIVHNDFSHS